MSNGPFGPLNPDDCYRNAVEAAAELQGILENKADSLAKHNAHRKLYFALENYRVSCNGSAQPERDLHIRSMEDIHAKDVNWLWHPYIPLGKVVLLTGDGGLGKSQLALWLAAAISKGDPLPGNTRETQGGILYFSNEDGAEDTIKPRCLAAGVDCSQMVLASGVQVKSDTEQPKIHDFSMADLDLLARYLLTGLFRLVVIDPIQSYLGGADMNSMSEVRSALKGLPPLAEAANCTILCLRHRSKKRDGVGKLSGSGSVDFTALCRSELIVAEHPDIDGQYAAIHTKSSCAKTGQPFAYEICPETVRDLNSPEIPTSRFRYIGTTTISQDDALSGSDDASPMQAALDFIHTTLANGPIPSKDLEAQAKEAGVKPRTLASARKRAGITASKQGSTWLVSLPPQTA